MKPNFIGFIFPVNANFSAAKFQNAHFNWAEFQNAIFFEAKFHQNAYFSRAMFDGPVYFNQAEINGNVEFTRAKLRNRLLFEGTKIGENAVIFLWDLDFVHGVSDILMKEGHKEGQIVEPAGQLFLKILTRI